MWTCTKFVVGPVCLLWFYNLIRISAAAGRFVIVLGERCSYCLDVCHKIFLVYHAVWCLKGRSRVDECYRSIHTLVQWTSVGSLFSLLSTNTLSLPTIHITDYTVKKFPFIKCALLYVALDLFVKWAASVSQLDSGSCRWQLWFQFTFIHFSPWIIHQCFSAGPSSWLKCAHAWRLCYWSRCCYTCYWA